MSEDSEIERARKQLELLKLKAKARKYTAAAVVVKAASKTGKVLKRLMQL